MADDRSAVWLPFAALALAYLGCTSGRAGLPSVDRAAVLMLPGDVPLTLIRVPAGTFTMGSPAEERSRFTDELQHQVTITKELYLGEHEVTQAQWLALMGQLPAGKCNPCAIGPTYPLTCISYRELTSPDGFFDRLNRHLAGSGQSELVPVRLPTEAEWEYAARAGTTTRFGFGDALGCSDESEYCAELDQFMVWTGNERGCAEPVGSRKPNRLGLYDMHGNVWEWVADRLGRYPVEAVTDPTGPTSGTYYVIRGGSWVNQACACRSAARQGDSIDHHGDVLGFRVAISVGSPTSPRP